MKQYIEHYFLNDCTVSEVINGSLKPVMEWYMKHDLSNNPAKTFW